MIVNQLKNEDLGEGYHSVLCGFLTVDGAVSEEVLVLDRTHFSASLYPEFMASPAFLEEREELETF